MSTLLQSYRTIEVKRMRGALEIRIDRPEADNSINDTLLTELKLSIAAAEADPEIKVIVLAGNETHFCTGMDFQAVAENGSENPFVDDSDSYYEVLKMLTTSSCIVIAKVEGKVNAGGIGLVAASDVVVAGQDAVFSLSEALFGLIPACVMPFLIRRIGHQKAQWLALTTQTINVGRAYELGLVDEYADQVSDLVRRNLLRINRLENETIGMLKNYMTKLWIIDSQTRKLAVDEISELMKSSRVQVNIKNFVEKGKFPWDK